MSSQTFVDQSERHGLLVAAAVLEPATVHRPEPSCAGYVCPSTPG